MYCKPFCCGFLKQTSSNSPQTSINAICFLFLNVCYLSLDALNSILPILFWDKAFRVPCTAVSDVQRFLVLSQYSHSHKFWWIFNPLNPELNPICYLLALLGAHHFLHVSRIRVKLLTFRLLMSYIYGAPILDVSRSHTTTQHSR